VANGLLLGRKGESKGAGADADADAGQSYDEEGMPEGVGLQIDEQDGTAATDRVELEAGIADFISECLQ